MHTLDVLRRTDPAGVPVVRISTGVDTLVVGIARLAPRGSHIASSRIATVWLDSSDEVIVTIIPAFVHVTATDYPAHISYHEVP